VLLLELAPPRSHTEGFPRLSINAEGPFDTAQGERKNSFKIKPQAAQAEPFDGAQDMLVEASFRRKSTVPSKGEDSRPIENRQSPKGEVLEAVWNS
jgi:hypothetical protein